MLHLHSFHPSPAAVKQSVCWYAHLLSESAAVMTARSCRKLSWMSRLVKILRSSSVSIDALQSSSN